MCRSAKKRVKVATDSDIGTFAAETGSGSDIDFSLPTNRKSESPVFAHRKRSLEVTYGAAANRTNGATREGDDAIRTQWYGESD